VRGWSDIFPEFENTFIEIIWKNIGKYKGHVLKTLLVIATPNFRVSVSSPFPPPPFLFGDTGV
jgi:hypothetical protein